MGQDDEDWQRQWDRRREHALARVRRGFSPPFVNGGRTERLLQIVYLPSFEDTVAWEVFAVREGDAFASAFAHRTAWRQKQDLRAFGEPQDRLAALRLKFHGQRDTEATMEYKSVATEVGLVRAAAERLSAITVSLRRPTHECFGLDGASYELTLGDAWAEITLRWWEKPPAEWGEAGAVTRELLEHLEELAEVRMDILP